MSLNTQALEKAIEFEMQYGPRCRDCANAGGICPASGLPCGGRRKAVAYVLNAYAYGLEHGFIAPILPTLPADTEVVHRAKAYLASQTRDKTLHPSHPDVIINDLVQAVEARPEGAGEVVAWRVRERPGFDWRLGSIDPDRDPALYLHEKEGLVTQASYLTLSAKVRALEARKPVYIAVDYTGVEHVREDRDDAVAIAKHNLASAIETATRDAEQANARLLRAVSSAQSLVDMLNPNLLPAGVAQQHEATAHALRRALAEAKP